MSPPNLWLAAQGGDSDDLPMAEGRLQHAAGINPEQAARIDQLSKRTGIPAPAVKAQPELVEAQVKARDAKAQLLATPSTRAFVARDQGNADLLQDHVTEAGLVEGGWNVLKAGVQGAGGIVGGGLLRASSSVWGLIEQHYESKPLLPEPEYARKLRETLAAQAKAQRQFGEQEAERITPKTGSRWGDAAVGGAVSTVQAIPSMAASLAARNPAPMLGMMGLQTAGSEYGKARDAGVAPARATAFAAGQGSIEVLTEKIPAGILLKGLTEGRGVLKTFGKSLLAELPGEQAATALQDLNEWVTINPDKPFGDYLKERPGAALETAIATVVNTGGMVATGAAVDAGLKQLARQEAEAEKAPVVAEAFDALVRDATSLPLLERSPERFRDLMAGYAGQTDVLIPASAMATFLQGREPVEARELVERLGISDQLDAATASTDVVINAADYITYLAPLAHETFSQDIKLTATGMSVNEAKAFEGDRDRLLAEAAERALGRAADVAAINDPVERVREDFYRQALATGVPEQQAAASAALQASHYQQRAARNTRFADAWEAYTDANISMEGQGVTTSGPRGTAPAGGDVFSLFKQDPRLVPAIRDQATGKIHRAKQGEGHGETLYRLRKEGINTGIIQDQESNPFVFVNQKGHVLERDAALQFAVENGLIKPEFADRAARWAEVPGEAGLASDFLDLGERTFEQRDPKELANKVPGLDKVLPYLTQEEREKLTAQSAKKLVQTITRLPKAEEMASVAYAGRAKRGWYEKSAEAILEVFGRDDAPRFAALLAALSPQTSVESNTVNALSVWVNWDAAGRPTEREAILDVMGASVQGGKGRDSILPSWINNSLRALTAADPGGIRLSGPKVNSFMANLVGVVDEVTNDAWMANYALVEQELFAAARTGQDEQGGIGGKSAGYLAMSAVVRKAADIVSQRTGQPWTPAEVQETVWSWAKTLYEKRDSAGDVSAGQLLQAAGLTHEDLAGTPDFAALFAAGVYRNILEAGGYGEAINRIAAGRGSVAELSDPQGSVFSGEGAGIAEPAYQRHLLRAARRIEQRRAAARERAPVTFNQAPMADAKGEITLSHWSSRGRMKELDPDMWGENWEVLPDDEKGRVGEAPGRVYWGVGRGQPGEYQPEMGIGAHRYESRVPLAKLYPIDADPQGLREAARRELLAEDPELEGEDIEPEVATRFEKKIKEAGFLGYWSDNPELGMVAATFEKVKSTYKGRQEVTFSQLAPGEPLLGLPRRIKVDGTTRVFGPHQPARDAAEDYMRSVGLPYDPPTEYVPVDENRARRIADAYEAMPHNPQDPEVKAAYDAMIAETLAQWQAIKATGLVVEFNPPGEDPYGNPRSAILDVVENNHLWVFPTDEGFGSSDLDVSDNPLLAVVPGEEISGRSVVVNDIFRIVHDYFGHIKEGVGFRADGEENAWRSHSAMYSPLARRAMTTETRGQNSWVNYGPHAEANKTASGADTVYADQKIGLLPDWVVTDGAADLPDTGRMEQGPRGDVSFSDQGALIRLFRGRNASTLIHEGAGHIWLENLARDAQDEQAVEEVRADLQTVKDWWRANVAQAAQESGLSEEKLLKAIDAYNGLPSKDVEALRPFHEMFARAAERYVMEGRAPTQNLAGVFGKFRQWLVGIYKDFTALRVPMTDEMRGVFDRLAAVPEAVETAKVEQGLQLFFRDPAQAGMTQAEYDAYVRSVQAADQAAEDRLLGKVMADIRRKYTAQWKTERQGLIDEFTETVNDTPEMRALTMLEDGSVRLSREGIEDVMPGGEAALYRRQRPYIFDEGLHPDVVAEQVGLPSGGALLKALADMYQEHLELRANGDKRTVRQARIEALADQEMLARHGDILNDGTIGDEAVAALHEIRRSEVLMSEVRLLIRKAGATTSIWSDAEMQRWAREQIDKMPLGRVRPHTYQNAEAKAGRDALKALVTDDFAEALDHKFRQLLNMHLYRAARDARERADKGVATFEKIAKARNGSIEKSRDMDMVGAARQIIAAYGFESSRNDGDYMAKVALYDPILWADLEGPVTAALAGAKPVNDLTIAEFDSLFGVVDQLWRMSRTSRQMEIDFQALELEDIASDLGDQLKVVIPKASVTRSPSNTDKAMRLVSGLRAALRRVESWVQKIDEGNKGPWRTYVWQPISEAATRYRVAKAQHLQAFVELLAPLQQTMKKGKIDAPELNHVFGNANSGVGKGELLHALLHTGNDSNKRKLLLGWGWASERADGTLDTSAWDQFLTRMHAEGVITKADWDFVQGVWDLLEGTKADAQKAHRRVFGRYFEEVTANEVMTPFGAYRGGYAPAIVDTFLVQDQALKAQENQLTDASTATMFPSPARGFTKSRVDYNAPLELDLGLLPQHIDRVLKFSHMLVPTRDVLRLLKEKGLKSKLEAFDPVAMPDLLLPWLNRAAKQIVEKPSEGNAGKAADAFFRAIRHRTGMGIMIANVSNTLQQLTGWSPAATKVKKRYLTAALWRVTRNPQAMADDIRAMSDYMTTRTTAQVHEAAANIERLLLDPSKVQRVSAFSQRHAYLLQGVTQNLVDMVTWTGAFEQAIAQGEEYPEAVRFADSVIRQTQGSLAPEDVSRFETGSPFVRVFTQFYSYFSAQGNLLGTEFSNARTITRVGYVYMTGIMIPAMLSEVIRRSFGAGWDDEDDDGYLGMFLDVFFGSQFRYATGMVPIAGQFVNTMANAFNDKSFDDGLVPAPAFSTLEQVAGLPKDIYKVITEGKRQKATVRETATLMTLLTGVPLFNVAARPAGYLADVNEGKVRPTGPLDLARGLVTGTASEASRVN